MIYHWHKISIWCVHRPKGLSNYQLPNRHIAVDSLIFCQASIYTVVPKISTLQNVFTVDYVYVSHYEYL